MNAKVHPTNSSIMLTIIFTCAILACSVLAGSFTGRLTNIAPTACKDICGSWINSIGPCVENSGNISFVYDPIGGNLDFSGDKISLYFCFCSNVAITTGGPCFECLSTHYCLTPPLNAITYDMICTGNIDISQLVGSTTAQC